MDEAGRLGIEEAATALTGQSSQKELFPETVPETRFVEIDRTSVRVENGRQFGGPWLALELIRKLGLNEFLKGIMPSGKESVPWSVTALILVIGRW
jgi:hypothetical protein